MWIIGILCGAILGFLAQWKKICIATSIQNTYIKNNSLFLQFILLFIALQAVGVNLLIYSGMIVYQPSNYSWPAVLIGSFLFGVGLMVAIQQKGNGFAIENLLGNGVAFLSFLIITLLFTHEIFSPIDEALQSFQVKDNNMAVTFGVSRMTLAFLLLIAVLYSLMRKKLVTLQLLKENWQSVISFSVVVLVAVSTWIFTQGIFHRLIGRYMLLLVL